MEDLFKANIWPHIGSALAAALVVLAFLKEGFGIKDGFKTFFKWVGSFGKFHRQLPTRLNIIDKGIEEIKKEQQETRKIIGEVHHQTHNNGGGSMNDRTVRLEGKADKNAELLAEIQEMLRRVLKNQGEIGERLRVRDDTIEAMIWHIEKDAVLIFANRFFLQLMGYQLSDVLGLAYENLIHPQDWRRFRETLERAEKRVEDFIIDVRIKDSHNSYYDCKVRSRAIKQDEGLLLNFYIVIDFITDRDKEK